MIKFFARGRCAQAGTDNPVTTGSVGIPVQFYFSQEWDALQKIAVFRAGDTAVDVALTGTVATVPAEVLTTAGLPLMIGVYGAAADGTIVIPTVWARAETIKAGTAPSGVDPAEPTPSWVAQVQAIAAEALETAEAVQAAAERGDFDGADGVSPTVTITSIEGGHRVTITDAAHPAGQSFDVMDGASGSGELLVVAYDAATPGTVPDVTEIADGFDAGQAVIACASDLDGGGHVLPLTSLERSGGSVTTLRFSAGGWTLTAGQVLGAWLWMLSEDATTEDLVLTFSAAWDSGADAYVVTTTATLAEIDAALAAGKRIDARLTVDNDLIMRQGSVYAERTGSQLVLAAFNFLDGDICYQVEGDTGGWLLNETHLGGGGGAVDSVNGQTGTVVLTAADVGAGTYSKPAGGIPKTDLASAVQTSLGKADTALQSAPVTSVNSKTGAVVLTASDVGAGTYSKPSGGIPASDLAAGVIPTVPSASSATPQALGTAAAGSSTDYSRADHVHAKPSASDVGAIAAPASPSAGDVLTYSNGAWDAAAPAHQIPAGGNAGECLAKTSSSDYDLRWRTINDWTPAGLMRTNGGTAAKVAEWSFWSATQYPAWLVVTVGNSNTYAGAITLKVNGSSAYPIYINGVVSSATNYTLPAGSYFVYFDGSKFDFRTDGKIPGNIIGHADQDIAAPASPTTGDFLCWNGSAWAATTLSAWQGGNY